MDPCNALMKRTVLQGFLMATAGFLSVSRSVLRPGDLPIPHTGPISALGKPLHWDASWVINAVHVSIIH